MPKSASAMRVAAMVVGVASWAIFAALALRTSRFPVVLHRYSKEYAEFLAVVLAAAAVITLVQMPRVFAALYARRHALIWFFVLCPLLIFVTVETAMRAFNLLGSDFYSEIRRYMTVLVLDPQLQFKNPANYRGVYQGVEIATDELGLRDRPLKPHAPGETRILVLGDSVAFGWGVKVEDTFPRQLEREIARSSAPVETINSGVPGYNTTQELTFLKLYADRLHPDAVLLLYVDNDIDAIDPARVHMGVLPDPRKDPLGAADYFLSMSRFYFMLRHLIPLAAGSARVSAAERRQSPGWRESIESLDDVARTCRVRGVPLAVLHFRMLDDPISRALNDDIEAHARAGGFFFADTLPWFRGRNLRRLTNSFIDTHPNAEGHRILAEGTARFWAGRILAPAASAAGVRRIP
ncbi:MAG TPA: SGNH/GDSL hydrolase family protein [Candidatus Sulfopaludibacter sp.]|nr:SGNH/GDSL hydrolase family protein [Candidatus Sulfopaludibacter sp.]